MGKAIGIDLGTTNSVVAYKDTTVKVIQTGVNNEDLCRSCVALDKSGQFLVGNAVYKNWKKGRTYQRNLRQFADCRFIFFVEA